MLRDILARRDVPGAENLRAAPRFCSHPLKGGPESFADVMVSWRST
jgi:hypothetical protein